MKDEILSNLDNPAELERLYRADKSGFKRSFKTSYPEMAGKPIAEFWKERLHVVNDAAFEVTRQDLVFVVIGALMAGIIANLPAFLSWSDDFFYPRNLGFVVFPVLTAFFAWKNRLSTGKVLFLTGAMLTGLLFINLFPDDQKSDTLMLSCIHLVLFLWAILGYAYAAGPANVVEKRLGFLRYNGDLIVMAALILISGGIMTGLSVNLFQLIGFKMEQFYFQYIGVFGLAAVPIVATYLTQSNPGLVGKVSPVIARIFSPLVLVMLTIYLVAMLYSAKDPYNDREFLMIFNALLIGVMAIIFFSVAGAGKVMSRGELWVLLMLSCVTIIVNGITLSAILFRISEWGVSPNRIAVLGANVLVLVNILLMTLQLFKVVFRNADLHGVGRAMSAYLPVYFIWSIIVTFIFPILFDFK